MKIRTDFVTNSSSSSFTVISIDTHDGRHFSIDLGETTWQDYNMCHNLDGKIKYEYCDLEGEEKKRTLTTVQQLLAVIYFNNAYDSAPFEVINPVFGFLVGKTSPRKLLEALQEIEGYEDLQEIDPDDFEDRTELRETVLESLVSCLEENDIYVDLEDEEQLESFKELVNNIDKLKDIANVTVNTCDTNWGEFTNMYSERLDYYVNDENHPFTPVSKDEPNFENAVQHWIHVMETEVLMGDTALNESELDNGVRTALETGNIWEMIPSTVQSEKEIVYLISEQ